MSAAVHGRSWIGSVFAVLRTLDLCTERPTAIISISNATSVAITDRRPKRCRLPARARESLRSGVCRLGGDDNDNDENTIPGANTNGGTVLSDDGVALELGLQTVSSLELTYEITDGLEVQTGYSLLLQPGRLRHGWETTFSYQLPFSTKKLRHSLRLGLQHSGEQNDVGLKLTVVLFLVFEHSGAKAKPIYLTLVLILPESGMKAAMSWTATEWKAVGVFGHETTKTCCGDLLYRYQKTFR
ncbi:MAG: hypothetical protein HC821_02615 [Lewinella sp.]|nr:hypothetical protein [Lewinella sp.]